MKSDKIPWRVKVAYFWCKLLYLRSKIRRYLIPKWKVQWVLKLSINERQWHYHTTYHYFKRYAYMQKAYRLTDNTTVFPLLIIKEK